MELNKITELVHALAVEYCDGSGIHRNIGEAIALIHSDGALAAAREAWRLYVGDGS